MKHKIRKLLIFNSLLLFPVTLNYLSPYVSIDGAFQGILAGSVFVFAFQFVMGLFFRRAWCGWVCPVAGISEVCTTINSKPVSVKKLRVVRYSVFTIWFSVLIAGFILAGGIKSVNPLHLTDRVVSVDEPIRFIMYYMIVAVLIVLTLALGRRGACQSVCWMSPFLTAGAFMGKLLHLQQLKIKSNPSACISCKKCNAVCPMSLDVHKELQAVQIKSYDCIQCGECAEACPKKVLRFGVHNK